MDVIEKSSKGKWKWSRKETGEKGISIYLPTQSEREKCKMCLHEKYITPEEETFWAKKQEINAHTYSQ